MSAMSSKNVAAAGVTGAAGSMLNSYGQGVRAMSSTSHSQKPASFSQNHGNARQSQMDMNISVKGKGSIRTLIRLANSRALNEEDEEVISQ